MNIRLLAATAFSILLLQGCSGKEKETVWGIFNEPVKREELPEPVGAEELSIAWKNGVGDAGEDGYALLRPAVDAGGIYVANRDGDVLGLDPGSGKPLWQRDLERPVYAAVGLGEGLVLAGMEDGFVAALSAADGTLKWEADIRRQISAIPAAGSGRVVVRTAGGLVIGLDAADGSRVWEVQRNVSGLGLHGDSMPLISGGTVITGFSNGRIIANAVINGRDYWETDISFVGGTSELDRLADIDATPVLSGTSLYAATYQGDVVAVDIQSSFVRWRRDISTRLPMAVDAGQIFVTGSLGDIVALDADSGSVLWRQNAFRGHGMTNPLVFDSRVVVGDASGFVHLLDRADGTLLQSLKLDRSAITGLARQGESVVAVSVDGTVVSVGFTGS